MRRSTLLLFSLVLIFTIATPFQAQAIDYYVDRSHPSASDLNPGTINQPWATITKANQTLIAGDTVYIKAGTYTSFIAPTNSGTSSQPITYRNYGSDTVTVTDTTFGIHLNGKSYIVVEGINFFNLDRFLWLENAANHNTIAYCNFDQGRNIGWSGSTIYRNSSYNWVHHSRFSKYGLMTTQDIGSVMDIGNEASATDLSNYNLVENNTMFHGGHHVLGIYGMFNVIRNNYFHNENWLNNFGNRNLYLHGYPGNSGRNLIEGNQIGYSGIPPDGAGVSGMLMATRFNVVRFNRFYHNNQAGISMSATSNYLNSPSNNKIYHNTFFHNGFNLAAGQETESGVTFARYSGTAASHPIVQNVLKNNVFRSNPKAYGYSPASLAADQILAGNWEEAGDPLFVNANTVLGDPLNSSLPNLHVLPNSPVINAGVFLTTVTSPSGSGVTFVVADAGYFMDGWGIILGDTIQLQGSAQTARITSINYATNTVTVNTTLTWTQGQGLSLAYGGTAPDIGAYESLPTIVPSAPSGLRVN